MKGAIMQPTYMPWLGYFAMIDDVDIFVFLDDVQLNKRSWQTRNRIKEHDEKELMLSISLKKSSRDETRICDAIFANNEWKQKHLRCISQIYRKCKYYDEVFPWLEKIYLSSENRLSDFSIALITSVCGYIGIKTKLIKSSNLDGIEGTKDELLVNICKKVYIDTYLSAKGSATYIEAENPGGYFTKAGIGLEYQNYEHPIYEQKGKVFMPYMSVIDLLFNCGRRALEIIRSGVRESYTSENVPISAEV